MSSLQGIAEYLHAQVYSPVPQPQYQAADYGDTLDCTYLCAYLCAGLAADIAQYASKYKPDGMEDKKPLAMVMSLDSRYFPEELYTSKERK